MNYSQYTTYKKVRLVEVVGDVPANLAILAPLLHHGMEESQHIDEAAEGRVWARRQGLMGDLEICGSHVQLQTIGRLCHYLGSQKWKK